jgi:hypothetical protein
MAEEKKKQNEEQKKQNAPPQTPQNSAESPVSAEEQLIDLDTEGEDHIADEARYFCMSRPIKPRVAAKPDEYYNNPLKIFLDIKKEDIIAHPHRPRMEIISEDN